LERLKRKHGPTLDDVVAKRDALATEYSALTGGHGTAGEIEGQLETAKQSFLESARELSAARRSGARTLAAALESELAELAMERARFDVRLETDESDARWSEQGIDAGEFYLSPNLGEDLRPLARIVSVEDAGRG
jgi:DNA repair protein RecN (Recombination protein N)